MMKTLISIGLLSLTLFSQGGPAAERTLAASLTSAHPTVSASDVLPAATAQPAQFRLAGIGDGRNGRPGNLRQAERPADNSAADGLPSTPVALAALLLMICILVGRRGTAREEV